MPDRKQGASRGLRRETAALLYAVSEDVDVANDTDLDPYRFSRQRNGHIRNGVEELAEYICAFGPGAWVRIRAYLDAVAVPDVDPKACAKALRMEEQEWDNEEDMAGLMAAENEKDERIHLDRLLRHRVKADRLIAYYQRKHADPRRTPRRSPSTWRSPEARSA